MASIFFKTGGNDATRKIETTLDLGAVAGSVIGMKRKLWTVTAGSGVSDIDLIYSNIVHSIGRFILNVNTPVGGGWSNRAIFIRVGGVWVRHLSTWNTVNPIGFAQNVDGTWTYRMTARYDTFPFGCNRAVMKIEIYKYNNGVKTLIATSPTIRVPSTSWSNIFGSSIPNNTIAADDKLEARVFGKFYQYTPP